MGVYLGDPYTLPDTDAKWRGTVGFRSDSGIRATAAALTNSFRPHLMLPHQQSSFICV